MTHNLSGPIQEFPDTPLWEARCNTALALQLAANAILEIEFRDAPEWVRPVRVVGAGIDHTGGGCTAIVLGVGYDTWRDGDRPIGDVVITDEADAPILSEWLNAQESANRFAIGFYPEDSWETGNAEDSATIQYGGAWPESAPTTIVRLITDHLEMLDR